MYSLNSLAALLLMSGMFPAMGPRAVRPSTVRVVANSDTVRRDPAADPMHWIGIPLTDSLITQFGAVKNELDTYWRKSPQKHSELRALTFGDSSVLHGDSALAAIFAAHHYSPTRFSVVSQSVVAAAIASARAERGDEQPTSEVVKANVKYLKTHAKELKEAGLDLSKNSFHTETRPKRNPN